MPLEADYFSSREQNAAIFEASLEGDGEFDELYEPSHAVIVADRPTLVQDEEHYCKKLEADWYKFLLQINKTPLRRPLTVLSSPKATKFK